LISIADGPITFSDRRWF